MGHLGNLEEFFWMKKEEALDEAKGPDHKAPVSGH